MTIEQKLKKIIIENYGSVLQFTQRIGMANSTFATIMKKGIHNANVVSIIKICNALGISADALAKDQIVFVEQTNRSIDIENEINVKLQYNNSNYELDGLVLSESEIKTLLIANEIAIDLIRRERKKYA